MSHKLSNAAGVRLLGGLSHAIPGRNLKFSFTSWRMLFDLNKLMNIFHNLVAHRYESSNQ